MPSLFDIASAPFVSKSQKRFHTDDSPERARRVADGIGIRDFAPHGLPPVGVPLKTGPSHLNFIGPGSGFDSRFEVQGDGRGGSWVTEKKTAVSMVPGFSRVMTAVHDVVTDPQQAYYSARRRGG